MSDANGARQKWALLIGINTYPNLVERDAQGNVVKERHLDGCVNDVTALRGVLERKFGFPSGNVTLLTEEAATRDGILGAMNGLVTKVQEDDVVVVMYAGHGSRRPDPEGDEADGWDSTILPYDSGRPFEFNPSPNRDITDDEIYLWLQDLTRKTSNVTLIFDSCRSGTITRDDFGERLRYVEEDTRSVTSPIPEEDWPRLQGRVEGEHNGWLPGQEAYVLLAGCRDDELAGEYRVPGTDARHGLLSYFLIDTLKNAQPGMTYRDLHERLVPHVLVHRGTQHPQLEGTLFRELFGVRDIHPMDYAPVVERNGGRVRLGAGAAQGLRAGSEWTVYPQGTPEVTDETPVLGRVRITAVHAVASEAEIVDEASPDAIGPSTRAVETVRAVGDLGLRVQTIVPDEEAHAAFAAAYEQGRYGRLLSLLDVGEDADARVYLIPPRADAAPGDPVPQLKAVAEATWAVVGIDGKLLAQPHAAGEPDAITTTLDNLAKIARVRRLLVLLERRTPGPLDGQVRLLLKRQQPDGTWAEAKAAAGGLPVYEGGILDEDNNVVGGERIEVTLVNTSGKPLYLYVLNIGLMHGIAQIYPPLGAHEPRASGEPFDVGRSLFGAGRIPLYFPGDFPFVQDPEDAPVTEGVDTVILLATTEPADLTAWLQESTRSDFAAGESELEQLLALALAGTGTRNLAAPPPKAQAEAGARWTAVKANFILRRA